MPYIGNDIRSNEDYKIIDDISSGFNGSTTSFALQVGGSAPVPFPKFESQLLISVNGVVQEPDPSGSAGFRLSGTNIVFSSAPTNGHAFFGVIYAGADYVNAGGTFPDGTSAVPSITFTSDTDTGIFKSGSGLVSVASNGTKVATFPTGQGTNGQVLTTDGAGVLSYTTPSTTASVITVADESSDTTCFPIFTTAATGNLGAKSGSNLTFNSSSGLLTATSFSGSGASLTSLNASNISSGTIAAARVATLNQNTTGSSASCTGNAATATALANARTIAGVSFDGSANISLNNNAITNGAGYITSSGNAATATALQNARTIGGTSFDGTANITPANATNADTVDSLHASSFLRSDANDSASGVLTLEKIVVGGLCRVDITTHGGGTVTIDMDTSCHHLVNMTANSTFAQPNNQNTGQTGSIFLVQDGTGSRTASFNSAYKFVGGTAPTLSTAANAVDRIDYVVKGSNEIHCAVSLDIK